MSDASNVRNGGMGRRVSEVRDLILQMAIVPPTSSVDFIGKLATEQGWPRDRAQRAYDEYQRFLLMAWVSPDMVVPSHDVDQAWHLHLTHSRHYWDVLCGTILQRPFHHDPSLGGESEDARHGNAYRRTLGLYAYLFDEDAPADVWPRGCTCGGHEQTEDVMIGETVLASSPFIPIALFGGVAVLIAVVLGHPWIAGFIGLATIGMAALASAAESSDRADRERRRRAAEARPRVPERVADDLSQPSYTSSWAGTGARGATSSRKRRHGRTASGDAGGKSSAMDTSGNDASLVFLALSASDGASATTHSTHSSHSGHHGTDGGSSSHSSSSHSSSSHSSSSHSSSSHSSHSCGSSSSHSCGSSSSSCGGSSCGGGGCGGS